MAILAAKTASKPPSGRRPYTLFLLPLLLFSIALRVEGATVTVPIMLDYPLLRQVLVKQLFNTPDQSVELLNDPSGCSRIVLANPRLSGKPPNLEIVTDIKARFGVSILGGCTKLPQWQGSAGFIGKPVIQPGATSLRLKLIDSWLVASDGGKITSGRIWDLTKDRFHSLFYRYALDLSPSINALGMILPDVLPLRTTQQLETIVGSLRLRDIQVLPASIEVLLGFQVEELAEKPHSEAKLNARELRQLENRWQMMDALFTFAVKYYASATNLQELRNALLETLLDSRYRLRDALTKPANPSNDPVRHWFLDSWKRLSPVIRRIGFEQTGQDPLLWISLLTATDALYALDRLGPAIGLDISTDGLRRLARLVNENAGDNALRYDQAIDPELQRLFRLPSTLEPEQPSGFRFDLWPIGTAWAGTSSNRLDRWAPNKDQLGEYLPLIASLLNETAEETLVKRKLKPPVATLFRKLVLTTAWQESCWRQYVVAKKNIEPLRSGSGDVGVMQINERVWRGFYDIQKLRWDIRYNSHAGAEVLLNYLVRYALKQGEHKHSGGLDNLARASYSAYNGGPSQISRYRKPGVASTHKKVDAAFWKKFQQVKAGNELKVAQCLGGETTLSTYKKPAPTAVKKIVSSKERQAAAGTASPDAAERWVLAQNDNRFTLQLAVFSKRASAQKFIAQQSLSGQIGIFAMRKGRTTQFAVLYGSYAKRAEAERAKQRLKHLNPWMRRFVEVRKAGKS
jgi:SPOR domain/Transglycosylase SLT domain